MTITNVEIEKIHEDAKLPEYAHGFFEDAGCDLFATEDALVIEQHTVAIPTGLRIRLPAGVQAEIRSKSGLASKGIVVANSPGTVDPGYRGEIKVLLHNNNRYSTSYSKSHEVKKGDKIAQIVFMPYIAATFKETIVDTDSARGEGGFGSTGK